MIGLHLGFITNNAGEDIPGSTIKYAIETYKDRFKSILVVDGNLTNKAKRYYESNNITVLDSPWTGRHVDQYRIRSAAVPDGDWLIGMDCDELLSPELLNSITLGLIEQLETSKLNILYIPVLTMWCKHNSNDFYAVEEVIDTRPERFHKPLIYKAQSGLDYIYNNTGTHVSATQRINMHAGKLPFAYLHMKSPETVLLNICICLMEDLRSPRGISNTTLDKLENIGKTHNLLTGAAFRRNAKAGTLPDEFIELIKTFKNEDNHLKYLYYYYFGIYLKEIDYEEMCESLGKDNSLYIKNHNNNSSVMNVFHTDVILPDPNIPAGAG